MNLTNYHSHCTYCDGKAPLEDFIKAAIAEGFTSYGVSSHAPLPFQTQWTMKNKDAVQAYLEECELLKKKYASQIEFYTGLEIDYLNEENNPSIPYFRELPLDYRIGSLHYLYDDKGEIVDIDCSPERFREIVDTRFNGDLDKVIKLYYERSILMIRTGGFDILGHADKVHYNACSYRPGLLDEVWYDSLINDYLHEIRQAGCFLEVNTKAFGQRGVFYPNQRYFIRIKKMGIPIQVNSDAHYPERINNGRKEALTLLKEAGFTHVMELHQGRWEETEIEV